MTLGGIDNTAYIGSINYVGVNATWTQKYNEWLVNVPGVTVNGVVFQDNPDSVTLVDTGTAYIRGPSFNATKAIYASISPQIRQIDTNGSWGAECDVMKTLSPVLTFTLADGQGNKVNITVDKDSFNLGEYPGQKGICQAVILHPWEELPFSAPFWVLGSPLIKAYYTVWDGGKQRLGFASIKSTSTTASPTPSTTPAAPKGSSPPNSGGAMHGAELLVAMFVAGVSSFLALMQPELPL